MNVIVSLLLLLVELIISQSFDADNNSEGYTMFTFTQQSLSPAMKTQLDSQFAFLRDISQKMFDGVQSMNALNMQVAATVFEESLTGARQLLNADSQNEALSIVLGQSQPGAEKMRAYQEHVQKIVADTQVGVAKSLESHAPESVRNAEAVVREVSQKASKETSKATQRQQEALQKLTTPIKPNSDRNTQSGAAKNAQ